MTPPRQVSEADRALGARRSRFRAQSAFHHKLCGRGATAPYGPAGVAGLPAASARARCGWGAGSASLDPNCGEGWGSAALPAPRPTPHLVLRRPPPTPLPSRAGRSPPAARGGPSERRPRGGREPRREAGRLLREPESHRQEGDPARGAERGGGVIDGAEGKVPPRQGLPAAPGESRRLALKGQENLWKRYGVSEHPQHTFLIAGFFIPPTEKNCNCIFC